MQLHLKKLTYFVLALTCLLAVSSIALAANPQSADLQRLTDSDSGKTFTVSSGTKVEIRLVGNITTGYSWVVASLTGASLKQLGAVGYLPYRAIRPRVGSGGRYVASFKATAPGTSVITMSYKRPWEKGLPAKIFRVTVNVNK